MYFHNSLIPGVGYLILRQDIKREANMRWNFSKYIKSSR